MGRRDDEVIDEYYIEDTWECSSCKQQNPGHDMRCKGCGSPKEKKETYQTGDIHKRVTDPTKLREAAAGPNRTCPFCKADNRVIEGRCSECGALVSEQVRPSTQPKQKAGPFVRPTKPTQLRVVRFRTGRIAIAAISVAAIASLSIGGYFLLRTHRIGVKVASTSWSVTRVLEQRVTKHDTGWGSPTESFNVSCETRLKDYVACHPHDCDPYRQSYSCRPHQCNCSTYTTTSSMGNGYSRVQTHRSCDTCYDTCSKTVYHTCYDRCAEYASWCEYDYYDWPAVDKRSTTGSGCKVEEPDLRAGMMQRIRQIEAYGVTFADKKGKQYNYTPRDRDDYLRFCSTSSWQADVSYIGTFNPVEAR